ncbi:hypothetical protein Clacol_009616, partial [Clathrus columnatus]
MSPFMEGTVSRQVVLETRFSRHAQVSEDENNLKSSRIINVLIKTAKNGNENETVSRCVVGTKFIDNDSIALRSRWSRVSLGLPQTWASDPEGIHDTLRAQVFGKLDSMATVINAGVVLPHATVTNIGVVNDSGYENPYNRPYSNSFSPPPITYPNPGPPPPLTVQTPNPYEYEQPPMNPVHNPFAGAPDSYRPLSTPLAEYDYSYHNPYSDSRPSLDPLSDPYERAPPIPGESTHDIPLLRPHTVTPSPSGYDPALHDQEHDEEEEVNIRYGRIPQRVPRRNKTIKRVELFHGNFVLDAAVPSKLLALCSMRTEREFSFMRYSAATCDPNNFLEEGYTLRQVLYDPPRRTELFIVLTMYNEDEELFTRTMHGVMRNIAHLCTRDRSKTWGKDGWKKVVVCIVSDGRLKINSRTLSVIATMGCYQDGIAKNMVNNKQVVAHIYEYTTQISVTPSMKIEGAEKGIVPVQVIFCLKEKNQKKINSHRWFFNAFGQVLQPNVCILLDVGTMPGPTSIYHLWKAFDINSNVGGACGEIVALKGRYGLNLLNPLVAAQNFEYKMSNILDKPLESVFGYITVLPGAFSAYRYIALQNDSHGEGPLQKYFLGEKMHGSGADIFTANMYLAEDRILCWELVSKRGGSWILHYVKSAYAVTDVPDEASSRTILSNALEDPAFNIGKWIRILNTILNYFYLGLLILCFLISLGNRPQGSKRAYTLAMVGFGFITIYMTFSAFFLAFKGIDGVKEQDGQLGVHDLFNNHVFRDIIISLVATLGLYVVASLLFFEPWHMITSFLQYLLMAPSYIAVLNVYAFANVHDVSWGTKGDNTVSTDLGVVKTAAGKTNEVEVSVPTEERDIDAAYEDALHVLSSKPPKAEHKVDPATQQEDYYHLAEMTVLLAWTLSNALLAAIVLSATGSAQNRGANNTVNGYMTFILYSVAGLALVRFIGSTTYMLIRLFAG